MENQNDRPPLTTIDKTGKYVLKMSLPKEDKVKVYDDGVSARLFFKTAEGLCFSKSYGTKYGKSLAMLVGKISGKYVSEPKATLSVPDFIDYLKPATATYFEVEVEVKVEVEVEVDATRILGHSNRRYRYCRRCLGPKRKIEGRRGCFLRRHIKGDIERDVFKLCCRLRRFSRRRCRRRTKVEIKIKPG